ncbi:hypothetical protein A2V80_03370 [Candidatus Woesebacteria bacterium RBG_16_39_8b]|uniref:Uncharacterized protein n=1 Tax=Candidatus Woesebacteria bacterium RBG_16_39_8b TaxID=1802482 RepID=A0A1F7X884_9BACT|nr:MAG: hypothetical protein A2V80_03370 [Candidatus Woesebacteria bacterium RBG_16_39_8b]
MDLDEEMKKLKERGLDNPVPLSKMAKITAASLDKAATHWAYKTYWDKKFLKLAKIDKLIQTEKDRVFNELILAGEALIMMTLEAKDLRHPEDFLEYLLKVKDEIPEAHSVTLKEIGVERKHRKLWKKLIGMRFREYSESKISAREAMMEYESKEKDLIASDMEGINLTLLPFTVAVGAYKHIVRSKTKGKDFLFKLIMKKLSRFYVEVRITMEGGKIPPQLKARMKLRHFWNDLKEELIKR